jgi:hypothetical protein
VSCIMLTVLGLPESAIAVAKSVLDGFELERNSSP